MPTIGEYVGGQAAGLIAAEIRMTAAKQRAAHARFEREVLVREFVRDNQDTIVRYGTSVGFLFAFRPSEQKAIARETVL